jgi:2-oxoglutarate dehydrogenase E2 component (dihydrolipoamide succinyltransferase)
MDHVAGTGNAASAKVTLEPAEAPAPATAPAPVAPAPADTPAVSTTVPAAFGGDDEVVQLSRLRTRIANNMAQAKATATHVWASVEVDYENVERVRRAHREAWKAAEGYSLTYLPFVVRATLDALGEYPVVNSSFFLDEGTQVFHGHVNLGIAVDMNQEGLVVVSVRRAEEKRLAVLAREIRGLAMKARDGKLDPDDISGSTFTITNPGPYGSFQTAPIINVPNVGILSTDTVVKRPTVVTMPDGSDAIAVHHIGYLGLSWDHRAFDGSTAVLFLNKIKDNLQTWDWEQELT